MTSDRAVPAATLERLARILAERTGLDFPPRRGGEIARALAELARLQRETDVGALAARLLEGGNGRLWDALAARLTVGETYFFRDERFFGALRETVLPDLRARRGDARRLRLWSAACATGEEAYSLTILVERMGFPADGWQVTTVGTDLNRSFLAWARRGIYRRWSFRNCPAWLQERYFLPQREGGYELLPRIRETVEFAPLNLADEAQVAQCRREAPFDLILLRNVLIYFTPPQARAVVRGLAARLAPDGWLVTTPVEGSAELFAPLFSHPSHEGLYRLSPPEGAARHSAPTERAPLPCPLDEPSPRAAWEASPVAPPSDAPAPPPPAPPSPYERAFANYRRGRYDEAVAALAGLRPDETGARDLELLARIHANRGDLQAAQACCERLLSVGKMSADAHILMGLTLLEEGREEEAERSLRRALYLDQDAPLAHYALAMIERRRGPKGAALSRMRHALRALRARRDDALSSLDGLTAERLESCIRNLEVS